MQWTFMLIVLWLTNGLPEPHTVAIPTDVECQEDMAKDMWHVLVKDRDDVSLDYSWNCEHAPSPEPPTATPEVPAPHVPQGDEA